MSSPNSLKTPCHNSATTMCNHLMNRHKVPSQYWTVYLAEMRHLQHRNRSGVKHYDSTTMLIIHSYLCASLGLTFSPSSRSLSRDVLSVFCSSSGPPDSNSCSWSWSWLSSSAPSAVDRDLFSGAFTRPEEHSANTVLHTGNTSLLKIEMNQPTEKDRTPESIQKMKH